MPAHERNPHHIGLLAALFGVYAKVLGADGDVAIYAPDDDKQRMFALPRYVIKSGVVVLDDGDLRPSPVAETRYVEPGYDPEIVPEIEAWFARDYSIQPANFAVDEHDLEAS